MSTIDTDLITVTEPARVSLGGLPNFLTIAGLSTGPRETFRGAVRVTTPTPIAPLVLTDTTGATHTVRGVTSRDEVGRGTFLIIPNSAEVTASNLAAALRGLEWLDERYVVTSAASATGAVVYLEARSPGAAYDLTFRAGSAWTGVVLRAGADGDALLASAGETTTRIDVELEEITGAPLSAGGAGAEGVPVVTLSKSYDGTPVWFDLNAAVAAPRTYLPPPAAPGVYDTGTVRSFRASARLGGVINTHLYTGDVLYAVSGTGSLAEGSDLGSYVIGPAPGRLLSDAPRRRWLPGQPLYVNLLVGPEGYEGAGELGLSVYVYDASGEYLTTTATVLVPLTLTAATVSVDTSLIEPWLVFGASLLRVVVWQAGADMSNALEWEVGDPCKASPYPVTFLSRLGGWEVYDLDAVPDSEYEIDPTTYERAVRPDFRRGESVEAVYDAGLTRTRTVTLPPVPAATGRWLCQLAASPAVFDPAGNAMIVTRVTLSAADTGRGLVQPVIEYHLSEGGAYA